MRKIRIGQLLLAGTCGLAAAISSACAPTSGATSPHAHNRDVLVCRDTAPTGSHISRPTCYKRAQIEERGDNDREKVRRLQHGGAMNPQAQQPMPR